MTKPKLDQGPDYERGFIDGMQHQMQSSVDKAVNAMTQPTYYIPSKDQRPWVGLTGEEVKEIIDKYTIDDHGFDIWCDAFGVVKDVEAKLKEKNT